MTPNVLLIDGLNVLRRIYEAQPQDAPEREAHSAAGARGVIRRARQAVAPSHALCVFDGVPPTWRHALYPAYKAGRPPTPEAVRRAAAELADLLREDGLPSYTLEHTEADDVIATVARALAGRDIPVTLLSTDSGYSQLLGPRVRQLDPVHMTFRDAAWCRQRFGVDPPRFADYLALAGSASDHLPGAPGVGPKRAATLLGAHGDLEAVLEAAPRLGGRLGEALAAERERLLLYRRLATLRDDLALDLNLRALRLDPPATPAAT